MFRRDFVTLAASAFVAACTSTDDETAPPALAPQSLDDFVREALATAKLPGLSIAIVKDGRVALVRHFGDADIEAKRPVTDETTFFLASLSKAITGTAVMTLVDAGKLSLDDDVNAHLSFPVRNPKFADRPITMRHLMTHTSGIQETGQRLLSLAKPGDPTMSLEELLRPYLVPGGATYVDGESYNANPPGGTYAYSNFGAALAGLVVEKVSQRPFATYVREAVFTKLGMNGTSYLLADLDRAKLATAYTWVVGKGNVAEPQTSVPFLPATTVRSPARDLARFLACLARDGELDGVRLLSAASAAEIKKLAVPASVAGDDIEGQGLFWELRPIGGARCGGHGGSYFGCSTRMHLRDDGVGVITLSNGDVHLRLSQTREEELAAYRAIETRLYEHAASVTT